MTKHDAVGRLEATAGGEAFSVGHRILATLEACAAGKGSLTLTELVDETALAKSTLHRTCWRLVELGKLEHSAAGFSTGVKLFALGNARLDIYKERVLARFDVPDDRLYQEVHRGHLSHLLDGEAEVLTDEIVRMTTLTGTAAEIVAVLRRLEAQGLRNVTLNPPPHLVRQQVDEYADKIAPLLRQSAS